ncbi:LamG-like jellyroll fold domain-containing protein (plasmid) [Catenovulum sp. SX2]|uniref:LamG-like jellyroll fold domain-containing protein n=1 Tax=Catenovulum sp. SX2 TaxID=3398614 RepID=UPI003F862E89
MLPKLHSRFASAANSWRSVLLLCALAVAQLTFNSNVRAAEGDWQLVDQASIEQGSRFYLRGTGYYTDNNILITDDVTLSEQLRLVVTSSSFAVLNADGTNEAGFPYFEVADINTATRIIFARQRGAFSYTAELQQFVEAPTGPSVNSELINFNDYGVHDPSVIKVADTYYVFGSHLGAAKSSDLMNWQAVNPGDNFTNGILFTPSYADALPEAIEWTGGHVGSWASDVIQLSDGKFYFYYNHCANPGSGVCNMPHSYLGVAVSDNIEGPYVDKGVFLKSGTLSSVTADDLPEGVDVYIDGQMPNAIDPAVYYDKEGGLWMIYGSHFGGIWVLEMDEQTAKPKPGQGYGTRLTGGNFYANEGSYMLYSPESDYYYLFTSLGGFVSDGGYNMRISRSRNPNGPFYDAEGFNMADVWGDPQQHGVKLMGGFTFVAEVGDEGTSQGYLAPGHNSAYYDETLGKHLLITHTRFPNRGEEHAIRVHEMYINEDGWLVTSPHRYVPIEGDTNVNPADIVGDYRFINHEHDTNSVAKTSVYINLTADGQVTGEYTGQYFVSANDPSQISLQLNSQTGFAGGTFNGVIQWQYNDILQQLVPAFTALSSDGITVWGSKLPNKTTAEVISAITDSLTFKSTTTASAIELPTRATRAAAIQWHSSHPEVIGVDGSVTRPAVGQEDAVVTLTATIEVNGEQVEKQFVITVKARSVYNRVAQFEFENNLTDSFGDFANATTTGDKIYIPGGSASYTTGINGQALLLDGTNGVLLPNNLISNYEYTVSFWINPNQITGFTPAFFAAAATDAWLSFLPQGWDGNTMLWSGTAWFDGTTGERISTNQWTHMAFSVSNGLVKVYLNGEEKYSGSTIADLFSNNEGTFALGVNYWDLPFDGLIDQLSIYDATLSLNEIIALDINQLTNSQLLDQVAGSINLGNLNAVTDNLSLPLTGEFTSSISWQTSDSSSITAEGVVTRPQVGQADAVVTLTATIAIGGEQTTREFSVTVKSLGAPAVARAHFSFDNHLADANSNFSNASIIGSTIGSVGGNENFAAGVEGQAIYLDGSTGVALPDGLIDNYQYTVSFWVNPTSTSVHTPMFFAANSTEQWLSFLPQNWWDGGTTIWSFNSGNWFNTQTGPLTTNQWTHVAFTVDNGLATIYVNGVESASWNGLGDLFSGQNATFTLGVNYWPDLPFNGYIDELKVFDSVLTDNDISLLATQAD